MPAKAMATAPERDLFDEAGALVASAGDGTCRASSSATLFGRVPEEDLAPYTPQALADLAAAAYAHLSAPRRTDGADLRLIDLEVERGGGRRDITVARGRQRQHAVPARFDARRARRAGLRAAARRASDPRRRARRDRRPGAPRRRGDRARPRSAHRRESFIQIHLDRIDDEAARGRLVEGLTKVYADVAVAVRDWPGMRDPHRRGDLRLSRQPAAAARRRGLGGGRLPRMAAPTTISPSSACASTACPKGDAAADPVEASGLGLLRDPAVKVLRRGARARRHDARRSAPSCPARRRSSSPRPTSSRACTAASISTTSASSCSRPRGGSTGELRIVGLFTASAYTSIARRGALSAPQGRQGDGARPASTRRATPAARSSTCSRTIRATSCSRSTRTRSTASPSTIMNLSERPRIRALARPDEFDRFVSVLVFIPKDRYDTTVRRRVGEYLAARLQGPHVGRLSGLSRRAARAHPLHHRPRRAARRRRSPQRGARGRHRRHRAHLGRRAARRRLPRRSAARRRGRSRRATPAPSRPPTAKPSAPSNAIADIAILERLSDERPRAVDLYRRDGDRRQRASTSRSSRAARSLPLSERVPLLENLGFQVVNERTYRVAPAGGDEADRIWLHDMALERAAGGAIDIAAHRRPDRGGAPGALPRACRVGRLQRARARGRARLARRRHGARASGATCARSASPSARTTSPRRSPATAPSRRRSSRCSTPASIRARRRPARRGGSARSAAEIEGMLQAVDEPRRRPHPAALRQPRRSGGAHQLLPDRRERPAAPDHRLQVRMRAGSTACRCRGRSTRSSSTRRASRACICASARSRAAACAGRTGRRISAPRCSAS